MNGLTVRETGKGKGVFAGRDFRKGEEIMEFRGNLITFDELPKPYNMDDDHYVQIGPNLLMGPSGGLDDLFNHSCEPNSYLRITGRKAVLIALRDMGKGEEITWDYSLSMNKESSWYKMTCRCGSRNCRKVISDFSRLPDDVKNRYIRLGVVPEYVLKEAKIVKKASR
ncbi:MAG: SET domain-containing protein [Candidatus Aenigmarchaeota archaeon]|nr:SET domain-containing protein [Candidatus Aenigmarchaeota archaeon]